MPKKTVSMGRSSPTTIYQLALTLVVFAFSLFLPTTVQAQDVSDTYGGLAFAVLLTGADGQQTLVIETGDRAGHKVISGPNRALDQHVVALLNMSNARRQYLLKVPTGQVATVEGHTFTVYAVEVNWRDVRVSGFLRSYARVDQVLAQEIERNRRRIEALELDTDWLAENQAEIVAKLNVLLKAAGEAEYTTSPRPVYTPRVEPEATLSGAPKPAPTTPVSRGGKPPGAKTPPAAPTTRVVSGKLTMDKSLDGKNVPPGRVTFKGTSKNPAVSKVELYRDTTKIATIDVVGGVWGAKFKLTTTGTSTYTAVGTDTAGKRVAGEESAITITVK